MVDKFKVGVFKLLVSAASARLQLNLISHVFVASGLVKKGPFSEVEFVFLHRDGPFSRHAPF